MCAGDEESGKNGSWIKGGQRIGVGEGKTETAREWRKSLKRHDKTERGGTVSGQISHWSQRVRKYVFQQLEMNVVALVKGIAVYKADQAKLFIIPSFIL